MVPLSDNGLLAWANTFSAGIQTTPTAVGLSSAQVTSFDALLALYQTALTNWTNDPQRSKSLTEAKHSAKGNLISLARQLYNIVKAFPGASSLQKVDLGVHVNKTEPTPSPDPTVAPSLAVKSVFGHQFRLEVRDAVTNKRARPAGCLGYTLYVYTGNGTPPASTEGYVCEGNFTKASVLVVLPADIAAGTKVYFTCNWYGVGGVSPGCTPVISQVGVEGVSAA